eukprot:TRINITY_DN14947_c0_g1_i1.p1 TRINITY_DN14947_c0_g1~~TRINITY_DN14947_c0_g1_i1.p1  ORF type:complete len:648 (+),score=162.56 TRINITY_DN14947_c0_g1_i1:79-1944(+)
MREHRGSAADEEVPLLPPPPRQGHLQGLCRWGQVSGAAVAAGALLTVLLVAAAAALRGGAAPQERAPPLGERAAAATGDGVCAPLRHASMGACVIACGGDADCSRAGPGARCCPTACGGSLCVRPHARTAPPAAQSPAAIESPTLPPRIWFPPQCPPLVSVGACASACANSSDCALPSWCCPTSCGGSFCLPPATMEVPTVSYWRAGCDRKPGGGEHAASATFAQSTASFGISLHNQLRCAGDGKKTTLFSPLSVAAALTLMWTGASGATAAELAAVLRLPPGGVAAVGARYAALSAQLRRLSRPDHADADGSTTPPQVSLANRLWGDASVGWDANFSATARRYFGAPLGTADFRGAPEDARHAINAWVSNRTEDMVPTLLHSGDVDAQTRLVAANAVYFAAGWRSAFSKSMTALGSFRSAAGAVRQVEMMHQQSFFGYAEHDGVQLLRMPYGSGPIADTGGISMLVALPRSRHGLPVLEASLSAGLISRWAAMLTERQEVAVSLPRLDSLRYRAKLGPALKRLGARLALEPEADFSAMVSEHAAPVRPLYIGDVVHEAQATVSEKGTVAAAATAVIIVGDAMPTKLPRFEADRPFLFAVRHDDSGALLFLARVTDIDSVA